MLVSPQEPPVLRALGEVSSECERRGADFLFLAKTGGLIAVQRKECRDLVASIRGDRLSRELGQIAGSDLTSAWLLIEGDWRWGVDGDSATSPGFSRAQYDGVVMAVQVEYGLRVMTTASLAQTRDTLVRMEAWHQKAVHGTLSTRPKSRATWGNKRSREWGMHVLQSFDGLSTGRAGAIYDHLGLPLAWTCTEEDFLGVPDVGPKTASSLWRALEDR